MPIERYCFTRLDITDGEAAQFANDELQRYRPSASERTKVEVEVRVFRRKANESFIARVSALGTKPDA